MEGCFGFDLRWVHARLGAVARARFDTHHLEEYAQTSAVLEKATSALAQLEGELSRRSETSSAHLVNNSVATKLKHFPLEGVLANSTPGSSGSHTWSPDAMEGPTPVSALIHAATMVTAGIFMIASISNYSVSVFHLMNHAFFKALLFLSAGSVIHAMSDEQDIRKMGGLPPHPFYLCHDAHG
uniref:NADH dehydrogenase subunit 5, mitochondrial n=1 Tax=Tanacetum cinerariifolium TaxID=118510 RepID=A0A699IK84_TANCI|nr:NADH dehydrogenase subunit 5, mitochondrial [Tanacetum cinerariifolium]